MPGPHIHSLSTLLKKSRGLLLHQKGILFYIPWIPHAAKFHRVLTILSHVHYAGCSTTITSLWGSDTVCLMVPKKGLLGIS